MIGFEGRNPLQVTAITLFVCLFNGLRLIVFDFIVAGERGARDCCKAESSGAENFWLRSRSLEE